MEQDDISSALKLIAKTKERIQKLKQESAPMKAAVKNALDALLELEERLHRECPATEISTLNEALKRAIQDENYEVAAILRDKLSDQD